MSYPDFPKVTPIGSDLEFLLSEVMECIFIHVLRRISRELLQLRSDALQAEFVLAVPAIATDQHKQFMKLCFATAAKQLDILLNPDEIVFAIEPEAAMFQQIYDYQEQFRQDSLEIALIDIGGGTFDFSKMTVDHGQTIKILQQPSGGLFGGSNLDDKFASVIKESIGYS